MIETPARVTRVEGALAWVTSEAPTSCGACVGKGCGSSVFNQIWHPDTPEYPVNNPIAAQPGEAVVIGLPDGSVQQAALLGYGLPIATLLLGAVAGQSLAPADLHTDLAAGLGALSAFLATTVWLRFRRSPPITTRTAAEPTILRRGPPHCAGNSSSPH